GMAAARRGHRGCARRRRAGGADCAAVPHAGARRRRSVRAGPGGVLVRRHAHVHLAAAARHRCGRLLGPLQPHGAQLVRAGPRRDRDYRFHDLAGLHRLLLPDGAGGAASTGRRGRRRAARRRHRSTGAAARRRGRARRRRCVAVAAGPGDRDDAAAVAVGVLRGGVLPQPQLRGGAVPAGRPRGRPLLRHAGAVPGAAAVPARARPSALGAVVGGRRRRPVPGRQRVAGDGYSTRSATLRNTAFSSIGMYTEYLLGMVTSVVIARHLGPDGFGVYGLLIWLVAMGVATANSGTASSAIKFVAELRGAGQEQAIPSLLAYLRRAQRLFLAAVLVVGTVVFLLAGDH